MGPKSLAMSFLSEKQVLSIPTSMRKRPQQALQAWVTEFPPGSPACPGEVHTQTTLSVGNLKVKPCSQLSMYDDTTVWAWDPPSQDRTAILLKLEGI